MKADSPTETIHHWQMALIDDLKINPVPPLECLGFMLSMA